MNAVLILTETVEKGIISKTFVDVDSVAGMPA